MKNSDMKKGLKNIVNGPKKLSGVCGPKKSGIPEGVEDLKNPYYFR